MKKLYFLTILICLAKLSTGQLTVNTTISNSTVCEGNSSTITASVTPSPTDPISYDWYPGTGLNTTIGATVIATPSATTTYTVTAANMTTHETGSTTVTVTIDPASNALAGSAGGSQVCQNINIGGSGTVYRDGNCKLIANIVPSGASPVTGSINTCVQVDTGATKKGSLDLYVARKYDIEPADNPSTATATVTLYFLQSEFDNYNLKSQDSSLYNIPTGPYDPAGISNMRIRQFHGTGTNPTDYTGGRIDFRSTTPGVSIVWNFTKSWWEITVPVNGFSGFYISSRKGSFATLPIDLEYFKGTQVNKKNRLSWKANCSSSQAIFEIERSENGMGYTTIGRITANQERCNMPFDFTDEAPLNGKNYYRIKIIDLDADFEYSNIILLNSKIKKFELIGMNPNLIGSEDAKVYIYSEQKNEMLIAITDMSGRRIQHQTLKLRQGSNSIKMNTSVLAPGAYLLATYMAGEDPQTIQFIKQ